MVAWAAVVGSTTGRYVHDTEVVRSANLGSKLQTTKTELVADFLVFFFSKFACGDAGEEGREGRGREGCGPRVTS